ncbi:hypothetical protein NO2_0482 [Candidatus Termititenax persephonae]|uniref:Carbohydrate-binding domain-containing protein n=1 Tax=Candidatus Termititenax persephonae TaxID=2218525 RepID=A0A388TGQ1_9BACT|nr:hypothetical protein NO2_0482 [Candidatus Termititenax persephonae]
MKINWQRTLVFLTILTLGLTLAGCGKIASSGGSGRSSRDESGGGGGRSTTTVETPADLINAITNGIDDITIKTGVEIEITENIIIADNKKLIVADGATLNVSNNVAVGLDGTIIVEPGAVLIDYGAYERAADVPLGPWQKNDTASIVFKTGAQGYRYLSPNLIPFVGDDNHATIELKEGGELILKRFEYELHGDAEIHKTFELKRSETAIVESGSELILNSSAIIALNGSIVVKSGATLTDTSEKLWSGDGNGYIVFEAGSAASNGSATIGAGKVLDIQSGTVTLYNPSKTGTNHKIYEIDGTVIFKANAKDPTWQGVSSLIVGNTDATIVIDPTSLDNPFDTNTSDENVEAGTYNWSGSNWVKE